MELLIDEDTWGSASHGDRSQIWASTTWATETQPDEKAFMFEATTPPSTSSIPMTDSFGDATYWSTESSDDEALFFSSPTCISTEKLQLLDHHVEDPCLDQATTGLPTIKAESTTEPNTSMGGSKVDTQPNGTRSGSRKRSAKDAGLSADAASTAAGELCWTKIIALLRDDKFSPGERPDEIKDETVGTSVMFKETPKRRRPHSTTAHPRDKWYNTGGIKSASDRFDSESGFGLRKRYGKVVRRGLPVLRFYEYKLLHCDPDSGKVEERKDGPTLMHLVPELKRPKTNDSDIASPLEQRAKSQAQKIAQMRTKEVDLRRQLAEANELIKRQAAALKKLQA